MEAQLFKKEIIHDFNFDEEYIGYTLDNSEFEDTLEIKVFIPELFGYNYNENISSIEKEIPIEKDHLLNTLNTTGMIKKGDFVKARILIERYFLTTKEEFIKACKPNIGDKVMVRFINGNPNNCVYSNTLFISNNEEIDYGSMNIKNNSTNENTIEKIFRDVVI